MRRLRYPDYHHRTPGPTGWRIVDAPPEEMPMEPYYDDGSVTIYHGDCRDVLPTLGRFDAVITDPPYGLDFRGSSWDAEIPDWLPAAREAADVVIFTTGTTTLWHYPEPDWVLCWARPASNARSNLRGGFSHWSPVLVYGTPKFPTDLISLHAIANATPKWIDHPSPKPEKLMRWLVQHGSPEGGVIVDPFAGSGTTGRAAKDLGRRAILIEREEHNCEIAVQRLSQAVLPLGAD